MDMIQTKIYINAAGQEYIPAAIDGLKGEVHMCFAEFDNPNEGRKFYLRMNELRGIESKLPNKWNTLVFGNMKNANNKNS